MGTRGYIVIEFKGMYYRLYNHSDSYPEGLGVQVVDVIEMKDVEPNYKYVSYLINAFLNKGASDLYITEDAKDVELDGYIEWMYLIRISADEQTFKILGGHFEPTFKLDEIPDNWIEKVNK